MNSSSDYTIANQRNTKTGLFYGNKLDCSLLLLELTAQNQLPLARLLMNSGTSLSLLGAVGRSWKDLVKSENYERINTSTETFTWDICKERVAWRLKGTKFKLLFHAANYSRDTGTGGSPLNPHEQSLATFTSLQKRILLFFQNHEAARTEILKVQM